MIYFYADNALEMLERVKNQEIPAHAYYGIPILEEEKKLEMVSEIKKIPNNSIVIIISPKDVIPLKKKKCKVILINVNSNHVLQRNNNYPKKYFIRKIYKKMDKILCISKSQYPKLEKFISKDKLICAPLGVDFSQLVYFSLDRNEKKKSNYYITSGNDKGRQFEKVIKNVIRTCEDDIYVIGKNVSKIDLSEYEDYERERIKLFEQMKYMDYMKLLINSKGLLMFIKNNSESSDFCGATTCLEAAALRIPIFINKQSWTDEFLPKESINYYRSRRHLGIALMQYRISKSIKGNNIKEDYDIRDLDIKKFLHKLLESCKM